MTTKHKYMNKCMREYKLNSVYELKIKFIDVDYAFSSLFYFFL